MLKGEGGKLESNFQGMILPGFQKKYLLFNQNAIRFGFRYHWNRELYLSYMAIHISGQTNQPSWILPGMAERGGMRRSVNCVLQNWWSHILVCVELFIYPSLCPALEVMSSYQVSWGFYSIKPQKSASYSSRLIT